MINKGKIILTNVINNKMNKTLVTIFIKHIKHKIYNKILKKNIKLYVHDEKNECNIGDIIYVKQCKPISKLKSWILVKIYKKNK